MNKIHRARWTAQLAALIVCGFIASAPGSAFAQLFRRCQPCIPCPTGPATAPAAQPGTAQQPGSAVQPGEGGEAANPQSNPAGQSDQTPSPQAAAPTDLFAQSGAGAASGPESMAPNMIGDYLGGFVTVQSGSLSTQAQVPLPGGAIPRFKMAENTSPIPIDRVFFDYDYYSDVPVNDPAISLNAFTAGFEKTFWDGAVSVELRLPVATTLDHNIYLDGTTRTGQGEIGNLGLAFKALLLYSDTYAVSGGLVVNLPTAQSTNIFPYQGSETSTQILNQSVHLLPFIGGVWTPTERLFAVGYVQMDIDANGDQVNNVDDSYFPSTTNVGRYYEQTMLYLEGSVGYWIRHDDPSDRPLNGIAAFCEMHMNQSMNTSQGLAPLLTGGNISILDMTSGVNFQFGPLTTVTAAYCLPLTAEREFDSQVRLLVNRRF